MDNKWSFVPGRRGEKLMCTLDVDGEVDLVDS